jgi:hypothetical protein
MAVFECAKCGHNRVVSDVHLGKTVNCSKCQEPGQIVQKLSEKLANNVETPNGFKSDDLPSTELVRRASGGSIQTSLGYSVVLNKNSSLSREWIAVDDQDLPAKLIGVPGITTMYKQSTDYSAAGYEYFCKYSLHPAQPLSAVETRFLTFDLWGSHVKTLSATEVLDLENGKSHNFEGSWHLYSETEASEFYASIAFIAQLRTTSGHVLKSNIEPVLEEAKQFSSKFVESQLEPSPIKL